MGANRSRAVIEGWRAPARKYTRSDKDAAIVRTMTAHGIPLSQICDVLGVSEDVLNRHYSHERAVSVPLANSAVASSLYAKALGEGPQSVTAAIFWLKTRAGWRETSVVEHSGTVAVAKPLDLSALSRDERATLKAMIAKRADEDDET